MMQRSWTLGNQLKTQKGVDDEILEYALSAFPITKSGIVNSNESNGIYIVPLLIICIVLIFFILKNRKNKSNSI